MFLQQLQRYDSPHTSNSTHLANADDLLALDDAACAAGCVRSLGLDEVVAVQDDDVLVCLQPVVPTKVDSFLLSLKAQDANQLRRRTLITVNT